VCRVPSVRFVVTIIWNMSILVSGVPPELTARGKGRQLGGSIAPAGSNEMHV